MATSKNAKRSKESILDERCRQLLARSLRLKSAGNLKFDDVKSLYKEERLHKKEQIQKGVRKRQQDLFGGDCRRILKIVERFNRIFSPLSIPFPKISRQQRGSLSIPIRNIVVRMSEKERQIRQRMATRLLKETLRSGEKLVPRAGNLWIGTGNTCLCVWEEMCRSEEFNVASINTANLEIVSQQYVRGADSTPFFVPGGRVDWGGGCILPAAEPAIGCSIASFECVDRSGQLYADTEEKSALIGAALKKTLHRIILIGEATKFRNPSGLYIPLPLDGQAEVFLCSDRPLPQGFRLATEIQFRRL